MEKQQALEKMDNHARLFSNRVRRGTLRESFVFTHLRTEADKIGIIPDIIAELYNYGKDRYNFYKTLD